MTDNESYGLRLEKKIDNMQSDIRTLSDHVTRLTFINETQKTVAEENRKDLDVLHVQFREFDKKMATQDGGISMLRYLAGLFGGAFIGACIWIGTSIIQINQTQSLMKENCKACPSAG